MSTHPHTKLFMEVDRSKDPDFFVRFMDEAQRHGHGGHRDAARAIAEETARMPSPGQVARRLPEHTARR